MTTITTSSEVSLTLLLKSLADAGYTRKRDDTNIGFVLGLVFDRTGKRGVGLVKQKGPTFLHGKITYPGGGREANDVSLENRTSDELSEEANILVAPDQWRFVAQSTDVAVFTAVVPDVSMARSLEVEPVFQFDVQLQLEMATKRPNMFAPDFIPLTRTAQHMHGF